VTRISGNGETVDRIASGARVSGGIVSWIRRIVFAFGAVVVASGSTVGLFARKASAGTRGIDGGKRARRFLYRSCIGIVTVCLLSSSLVGMFEGAAGAATTSVSMDLASGTFAPQGNTPKTLPPATSAALIGSEKTRTGAIKTATVTIPEQAENNTGTKETVKNFESTFSGVASASTSPVSLSLASGEWAVQGKTPNNFPHPTTGGLSAKETSSGGTLGHATLTLPTSAATTTGVAG
jgi:hypothetical protein